MADFTSDRASATTDIRDNGQSVTFSYEAGGTFDPETGLTAAATTTTFSGYALTLNYKNSEIDGSVIKKGDVRLLLEYVSTTPEADYTCTVDGTEYRVVSVDPLDFSGYVIFFNVQLRK